MYIKYMYKNKYYKYKIKYINLIKQLGGTTAEDLFKAIEDSNIDLIKKIVTPNNSSIMLTKNEFIKNKEGNTPLKAALKIALKTNNFDIFKYLLDYEIPELSDYRQVLNVLGSTHELVINMYSKLDKEDKIMNFSSNTYDTIKNFFSNKK